jgi:hypothetical protein
MAMGTRRTPLRQESLWIPVAELPGTAAHTFYQRLNQILNDAGFDAFVEEACQRFYAPTMGRLAPGIYFRVMLIGYFEGLDTPPSPPARARHGSCGTSCQTGGVSRVPREPRFTRTPP